MDIDNIQVGVSGIPRVDPSRVEDYRSLVPMDAKQLEVLFSNPGIKFIDVEFNQADFDSFLKFIDFSGSYPAYHASFVRAYSDIFERRGIKGVSENAVFNKYFEQFIATKVMETTKANGVMDIACDRCPFVSYANTKFNAINCYAQDLTSAPRTASYLSDNPEVKIIVSNATKIPLEDSSLDFICLLNSWEHFQAPYDLQVLIESSRLLRKGGKILITPLNLNAKSFVSTDLGVWETKQVVRKNEHPQFRVNVAVKLTNNKQTYAQCHSPDLINAFIKRIPEMSWQIQKIIINNGNDNSPRSCIAFVGEKV
jgi:SAM-dependent methyltransferase